MCKKRTTVYINDDVLKVVKVFAINNNLSVSEVIENLLSRIPNDENIVKCALKSK